MALKTESIRPRILAHITDAHVAPHGRSTTVLKERSVALLDDLVDQLLERGVDCVMFGGDNIDNRGHGEADLDAFMKIAERLPDWVCILGNHEVAHKKVGRLSAKDFAARVDGHGIGPRKPDFVHSVGNVRIVGIDTTLLGSPGGYVSPPTMEFLQRALHEGDEEHVVVLGHHLLHPAWEPLRLESWDKEYLISNREHVAALLGSCGRLRAYLCGHHHAPSIRRIQSRGFSGGFYQVLSGSPSAFPHRVRVMTFHESGIEVESLRPRLDGLIDQGQEAVLLGRKAKRFATMGASGEFLNYVGGRPSDNDVFLPYDQAPREEHRGVAVHLSA